MVHFRHISQRIHGDLFCSLYTLNETYPSVIRAQVFHFPLQTNLLDFDIINAMRKSQKST